MITTKGRALATQSSATQEAREENVKQELKSESQSGISPLWNDLFTARLTERPKIHEATASTPSSSEGEHKTGHMNRQLTDDIDGASSGGIMNVPVEIFVDVS